MKDPRKILTDHGYRKWMIHLECMREASLYMVSHDDDLHLPNRFLETLHNLMNMLSNKVLEHGDEIDDV